ncbi:MAG: hypothetical protein N2V77_04575 [Canidatus Methanoxibalbensis ujae]|nr:hypothetical protein [Candidatus Methanoxibalbensis ujae]MCW7078158.1 hypothetical protein [Candidatus Methanoxibalbensis ujae]
MRGERRGKKEEEGKENKNEEEAADEKERLKKEIALKIMEELGIKGVGKRRLLEKLVEQYDYDEAKVRYKAKRAFITYRYAKLKSH